MSGAEVVVQDNQAVFEIYKAVNKEWRDVIALMRQRRDGEVK